MLQELLSWRRKTNRKAELQKELKTLLGCSDRKEEAVQEDIRLLSRAVSVRLQTLDLLELVAPFHSV